MNITGKTMDVTLGGKTFEFCNQRSEGWDWPYPWQGEGNLHDSGCGIFSVAHIARFLCGTDIAPETLGDFSCETGGRGDDGTDRPILLAQMQEKGLAAKLGFEYRFDGLLNDLDLLYRHLAAGNGALCNLRPGHIVALVGAREQNGEKQVLAIDSYSESADSRVIGAVRECIPGSEIVFPLKNQAGVDCGRTMSYCVFWAALYTVRDYNLLYIKK